LGVYAGVREVLISMGNREGPLPRDCDLRFIAFASSWIVFRRCFVIAGKERLDLN
jgi:hypothetical protein